MKKLLFLFSLLFSLTLFSQVKISDMPTYSGAGDNGYVPVVIGSVNYKILGKKLATTKVDSVKQKVGTDSVFQWKNGVKSFAFLLTGGGCNLVSMGADPTGVTDASTILQAAINSGCKYIKVGSGTFLISNQIQMKDSVTIIGEGSSTIFKLASNITAFKCGFAAGGFGCNFFNFAFKGTLGSGTTSQQGIFIDSAARCLLSNVRGTSMAGYVVKIRNNGYCCTGYTSNSPRGNMISNCHFESNYGGVLLDTLSEYNTIENSQFLLNTYGVFVAGGNNRVNGNSISANSYNFYLTGGSNNGHGVALGNTINHGTSANVYATGTDIGFDFVGNMIYSGAVTVINCDRITFKSGDIRGATYTITNSTNTIFFDISFSANPTWVITGTAPTVVTLNKTSGALTFIDVVTAGNSRISELSINTGMGIWKVTNGGDSLSIIKHGITGIELQPFKGSLKIDSLQAAPGTKALRWDPSTQKVTAADTTLGGASSLQAVTDVGNHTINDLTITNTAITSLATLFNLDNAGAIALRAKDSSNYAYFRQLPLSGVQYTWFPAGSGNDTLAKLSDIRSGNSLIVIGENFTAANNSGTSETDLHSYTIAANQFYANGQSVSGQFAGTFNDVTATAQVKVYFAGTVIFNSGSLTVSATGGWTINVNVIRTGTTTAKAVVNATTPGASTSLYTTYTSLSSQDFTTTNILKVTGQAGGAGGGSSDITAELSKFFWTIN